VLRWERFRLIRGREEEDMTASADHIKALVRAHAAGDESGFYSVALRPGVGKTGSPTT
jgi:hypothetical protein